MRLKFREKTYLITLVLFLLFLNAGIFSLAYYSYQNSMDGAESLCRQEERVIAEAFEKDCEFLNHVSSQWILMRSYGEFYSNNGIYLGFYDDDIERYSNLPQGIFAASEGKASTQKIGGSRYLVISEPVLEDKYIFTYAKDVSYLDDDFLHISLVFIATSLGASALLAVCLFVVLRKLSMPLERLRVAAGSIADGNYNTRADQSGKDEFSLLAADFNRMAEQVSRQMSELDLGNKTKQRMLDNLAHEMRTPLTSIRGYAEYLRDANIPEEEKIEALEFIISESERLRFISERLLDEAFIRENSISPAENDLGEMIFGVVKKLGVKAANAGVALCTDATPMALQCDRLLTELLIINLADNAIKACRGNGRVTISNQRQDKEITVTVTDNGVGMTNDQLAHITEPFYRTDKSRSRDEGGTGLGLSLCKKIADAHGAKLEFFSEIGKGTSAKITFTTL